MSELTLEFENDLLAFFRDPQQPEEARKLALYCSVPYFLTSDLVRCIRDNSEIADEAVDLPGYVLRAPFVHHIRGDYYRMERSVRDILRHWLKTRYGDASETQIASILNQYVRENRWREGDLFWAEYLLAQQMAALAVLHPRDAAEQIANELGQVKANDEAAKHDLTKWAVLAEEAAIDLRRIGGGRLVEYARCRADLARGRDVTYVPDDMRDQFTLFDTITLPGLAHWLPNLPPPSSETDSAVDAALVGRTRIIAGHRKPIHWLAWSADGSRLLSAAGDSTARTWLLHFTSDAESSGGFDFYLSEHPPQQQRFPNARQIAWSPDAQWVASVSGGQSSARAQVVSFDERARLLWEQPLHDSAITSLSWSPDGRLLATGSLDYEARVWDARDGSLYRQLTVGTEVACVAFSPDGKLLATGSQHSPENIIHIWNIDSEKILTILRGHSASITCLTWWRGKDGSHYLASGAVDSTVRVWDVQTGRSLCQLNMHTAPITSLSVSHDGTMLASAAQDETVCFWSRKRNFELVYVLTYGGMNYAPCAIAFHPHKPLLAAVDDRTRIAVTPFNLEALHNQQQALETVYYSIAKVAVVGDGGVGKSSLCRALLNNSFEEEIFATHGMNILRLTLADEQAGGKAVRREIYLYDLAGQGDYQLVHQLYLSSIALVLMVFAMNSGEPFQGLRRWNQLLQQIQDRESPDDSSADAPNRTMTKVLVQTRIDQIGAQIPSGVVQQFMERIGCDAFFATSAKDNIGIEELRLAILRGIEWERITQNITTVIFDQIRAFLEMLQTDGTTQIVPANRLYQMFLTSGRLEEARLVPDLRRQFDTSLKFLEARQIIRRFDFGSLVLLRPELLSIYASSIIAAARRGERSRFGSIKESEILQPDQLGIPEDQRIRDREQEEWMLIATMRDLLRYEVALREEDGSDSELIFPSHFITGQDADFEQSGTQELTYTFKGAVINIYAVLIVRLARSNIFELTKLARHKAQFLSPEVSLCGISLEEDEDEGALHVYFDTSVGQLTRYTLDMFTYNQLSRLALKDTVRRQRVYYCANPDCPSSPPLRFPHEHVEARQQMGKNDILCPICGASTPLGERALASDLQAELKRRLALMNRQADIMREEQTAASIYHAKQATGNFDVYLEAHPPAPRPLDQLVGLLRKQGIYCLTSDAPLTPTQAAAQVKSVLIFLSAHPLTDEASSALASRVRQYLDLDLPVIFALHQVEHLPDLLLRGFNQRVESVYFFDRLDDRDALAQLVGNITGREPR